MSQAEFLRQFDLDAMAGFLDAGLADTVLYTGADGVARPCTALIDRDVQTQGEYGQTLSPRTEITLQHREVTPVRGAVIGIDAITAESWILVDCLSDDGSLSRWTARRG